HQVTELALVVHGLPVPPHPAVGRARQRFHARSIRSTEVPDWKGGASGPRCLLGVDRYQGALELLESWPQPGERNGLPVPGVRWRDHQIHVRSGGVDDPQEAVQFPIAIREDATRVSHFGKSDQRVARIGKEGRSMVVTLLAPRPEAVRCQVVDRPLLLTY